MKQSFDKISSVLNTLIFKYTWLVLIVLLVVSFLLRLWQLGYVKEEIFDEVYFVKFAGNYLSGTEFFDIHPPLGKLIIALGLKIVHINYFNWRITEVIFGTLIILIGYLAGKELYPGKNANRAKTVGLFTALILALDGMILVYSRIGLMDMFMIFFILFGFYAFLRFSKTQKISYLMLAGILLGLAASVKYIAALLIFVYIVIIIVNRVSLKKYYWQLFVFILIIPTLLYLALFAFNYPLNTNFINKVIEWHKQSLNYNFTLKEGHPYGSKWWSWYLLLRPIWFYFKDINGNYSGIVGLGNPVFWWSSIIVIPTLLYKSIQRDKTSLIVLISFLIMFLPWSLFDRVLFYYHALPSFIFLSLGIAYLLEKIIHSSVGKLIVFLYYFIALLLFCYFFPIWTAIPINQKYFYHHMWIKGWI